MATGKVPVLVVRFLEDGMETLGSARWKRMDRHTAKRVYSVSKFRVK